MKGFTEAGRDRYVSDAEFQAVRQTAYPTVQDVTDIALLTGQRPVGVLKIMRADVRDGPLFVTQNKTGPKHAIEIVGELAEVLARINSRPRDRLSAYLIQDDNGRPLTALALRTRFDKPGRLLVSRSSFATFARRCADSPLSFPATQSPNPR